MQKVAKHIWRDHKTNDEILNKLKVTSGLDTITSYKSDWVQHVNQIPRSRLLNFLTKYAPRGKRNQGRPLKRFLDEWDWNRPAMAHFPEIWWWWFWTVYASLPATPNPVIPLSGNCTPCVHSSWTDYSYVMSDVRISFSWWIHNLITLHCFSVQCSIYY
jgi:hypothetical protein